MTEEGQGLYHVCVQENYRKHGIGQKLVERCLEALKAEKNFQSQSDRLQAERDRQPLLAELGWKYCDNVNYYE